MENLFITKWKESSDIRDFLNKIKGVATDSTRLNEFELYLIETYGKDFNKKSVIESIKLAS